MTEDRSDSNPTMKRVRKKRKNFLANAKKYAKKGQMGRGTKISEEMYQYFVGILDAIKQGIEDKDEREALVNNVLERTKGEELNIIGNQLGCRVVELLLPYSTSEDLERFMEIIDPELRRLCSDNFSSHVVETLLRVSCERATKHLQEENEKVNVSETEDDVPAKKKKTELKTELQFDNKHRKKCHEFTIKICKYALNNLEDFVWDLYANHILRSAIKCLSGITLLPGEKPKQNFFKEAKEENKGIPPHLKTLTYKNVPEEFKEIVKEFAERLSSWPQFKDLPYKNLTSALLQVLLYALKNVDEKLTRNIVKRLLNESFAPDDWVSNENSDEKKDDKIDVDSKDAVESNDVNGALPPVFTSEAAVRLLEAALFVSKKKMYTQLYAKCFINRLGRLALVPMLNFTVQRLIDNCEAKEEFEPMFDELSDKYGAIIACNNTGVLIAIAKACLRLNSKQTQFVSLLESALECNSPEHGKYFPILCLRLLPRSRVDLTAIDKEYFINMHGSVILQTILNFQRPAKAVNSLLELSAEQILVIFCDNKGSHVADAFCKGQCVGAKSRDKMLKKLKGNYQKMALSQHGSRALDQLFETANLEQKVKIMSEISEKSNLLNSTAFGKLMASKLDVELFKKSQKKWEKTWAKKMGIEE